MRRIKILLCGLAALALVGGSLRAQQGEGTGADFLLETAVNGGTFDDLDKSVCPGDVLSVRMSTGTYFGATYALAGDVASVSLDINEFGVLGTGINRFAIVNSLFQPFGATISAAGEAQIDLTIPSSTLWNDGGMFFQGGPTNDIGLFLQAGVAAAGGSFFGIMEISNSIKHEVLESPDVGSGFSDTCEEAVQCTGLSDADLGIPFQVDTSLFNNDYETTGTTTFNTTTMFSIVGPGLGDGTSGTAPDALIKFTATAGGYYTFSLCNSAYDTRIWLQDTNCASPTGIVVQDDNTAACGPGFRSQLDNIPLSAGQEILVVVEGFGTSSGLAELVITRVPFVVSGISPATGPVAGGTLVTLTGEGLSGVTSVTFDGVAGTGLTVIDPMTVEVTTPAGAMAGNVDVVVSDGVESVTLPGAFQYFAQFVNTSLSLSDDGSAQHTLTVPITYGGTTYNDVFVNANGQITFAAPTPDFTDTMSEFFDGWGNPPNPGVAVLYTDLNRGGSANSGSTYDIVEDTLNGTVEIQYNNQQYWNSQAPAGNAIATFSTNHVDLDWTGVIADTDTANNYVIGVTDGDAMVGTDTDLTVIDPVTMNPVGGGFAGALPYTSMAGPDSVGEQLPASTPFTGVLSCDDPTGTFTWTIM